MELIVDTHLLVWAFNEPKRLSRRAISILANTDNTILVPAAVAWELSIKANLGKLEALPLLGGLAQRPQREGFTELPISIAQAFRAGLLPLHHRDPFDRLLVAQAQDLGIPVLSADELLDRYDVKRAW
jgi:PIN domain nuclease of toxin-antitoxin system